jgi:transcription-repair coupling factor (superfamily II helicase)
MDAKTLARKMRDFERGKYDVLLSTTIVESGIDIPRANTIIIDQAHTFGLADLYQLRGRVGRASAQGRALLLLPPSGIVDSDARERLKALQRHSALGAGFNLAVRDLELRGAGNLLGSQQSGHIAAVGFGLYCQLLQRTVAMLKGEKVRETVDIKLNLDFLDLSPASEDENSAAALPYGYVEEDSQRMGFMKRLAEAQSGKDVRAIAAELEDRFGKMPAAARRLIKTAQLRMKCSEKGISAIDVRKERAVYYRAGSNEIAFVRILKGRTADQKLRELDFK